jgi:hypothetical protein
MSTSHSGGDGPPAARPPITHIDPAHGGDPVQVQLNGHPLGDLGHPRTDAALIAAILLRGGTVGDWLTNQGLSRADVERAFGPTPWPRRGR